MMEYPEILTVSYTCIISIIKITPSLLATKIKILSELVQIYHPLDFPSSCQSQITITNPMEKEG